MKKLLFILIYIVSFFLVYSCNGLLVMPDFIAQAPWINMDGGIYDTTIDVTITSTTPGATIYYTTDGTAPDETKLSGNADPGISVLLGNTILKASTWKFGYTDSRIVSRYFYRYGDTRYFGGGQDEIITGLFYQPSTEQLYITGQFQGLTDLDPGTGTALETSGGYDDIFITKLDGNYDFLWGFSLGSIEADLSRGIVVDSAGNAFIIGTLYKDAVVSKEIFIIKVLSTGVWGWTKLSGGSGDDYGTALSINTNGALYYSGVFTGTADIDPRENDEIYKTADGNSDISITRIDAIDTVGTFTWSIALGGSGDDELTSLAHDTSGNLIGTGFFTETTDCDLTSDNGNHLSHGREDALLVSYDENGGYIWSIAFGGSGNDRANDLYLDSSGNIYLCGTFEGTVDFDPGVTVAQKSSHDGKDIFISRFDSSGIFQWVHTIGGPGDDIGTSICIGNDEMVFVTGSFRNTLYSTTTDNSPRVTSSGEEDCFILSLYNDGSFGSLNRSGNDYSDFGDIIIPSPDGNIVASGSFNKSIDANPGPGEDLIIPAGMLDSFISRYLIQ